MCRAQEAQLRNIMWGRLMCITVRCCVFVGLEEEQEDFGGLCCVCVEREGGYKPQHSRFQHSVLNCDQG